MHKVSHRLVGFGAAPPNPRDPINCSCGTCGAPEGMVCRDVLRDYDPLPSFIFHASRIAEARPEARP